MKYIINSGVYSVDFKGTNNAEFNGTHPALILKSVKNEDMYYVIPLTTYTKERWKKYRIGDDQEAQGQEEQGKS